MDYYEVPNSITNVPRLCLIHKTASDFEEACVLSGLKVSEVGSLDASLRQINYLLRELLKKGYIVRLPGLGTFKGRLSSDMVYSVSYKMDTNLLTGVAVGVAFTKVDRPSNFITGVSTSFGQNTANVICSHSVVCRGLPFYVNGKFLLSDVFKLNSSIGDTSLTQITKSSSKTLLRLDSAFPGASSSTPTLFIETESGLSSLVAYSVLRPVFDNDLLDLFAIVPFIGDIVGHGENDFYGSTANFLGFTLTIDSNKTSFTLKLVKKIGLTQYNASNLYTFYPSNVTGATGLYFYAVLGNAVIGFHRANFMAYFYKNSGCTRFFKIGG